MSRVWVVGALLALAGSITGACGSGTSEPTERAIVHTTTTAPAPTTTAAPTTTVVPLAAPALPATASDLAARLTTAERTVRDPATAGPALERAAFDLQVLYRQLARTPDWDAEVTAAMPADLAHSVTANVAARREFRGMHRTLSDTLPAWRIIDPAPAEDLLAFYAEGEATFGVPWTILAAVNLVETGMGRIRGTSVAGAQGPMQFIPGTWEAFGEGDINDPRDAILSAARYLAHNGGGRGEIDNALFRYNNHDNYVRGVKHYASVMQADPRMFHAFYHWQIVYLSEAGDIWLPVGYEQADRIAVADYLAANPGHHLGLLP